MGTSFGDFTTCSERRTRRAREAEPHTAGPTAGAVCFRADGVQRGKTAPCSETVYSPLRVA